MATIFGHMAVAAASANTVTKKNKSNRGIIFFLCLLLSIIPDFDVIAFKFGIPYHHPWGHRGATHSIVFALGLSLICYGVLALYSKKKKVTLSRWVLLAFFISIISHPLLDMLTNGGLGCALFWPFESKRHFFSITPIPVSPIGIAPSLIYVIAWEFFLIFPIAALSHVLTSDFKRITKFTLALFYGAILVGAYWIRVKS